MKILIIIVTVLLVALPAATVYATVEKPEPNNAITAAVGAEFEIKLEAIPSTGYRWEIDGVFDDRMIEQVSREYVPDVSGLVGSGGKEVWTFRAKEAGRTSVSFKYVRPWEKHETPAGSRTFEIVIEEVKQGEAVQNE